MTKINDSDIKNILMRVENPGRYAAGEFGSYNNPPAEGKLNIAISYPDLYEIGMANNAVKILYNMLNSIGDFSCDRVFAPAPDFEKLLRENTIPLFSLENRTPLSELDILGFSLGYELTATNLLNIMNLGNIPLLGSERDEKHPLIIAGGPGVTNPLPYSRFIDFFYIGEAENTLIKIFKGVLERKKTGASRKEIFEYVNGFSCIYSYNKKEKTVRDIWGGFGSENLSLPHFPVPSVKSVQDHGVVEIMRGCPNGCRFCHAGIYYRPKREKDFLAISEEIDDLVYNCGYREITLSSLSSGDYCSINEIISSLNERYSEEGVSFALPSLKINSFTLPLLEGLNKVRKSGLTFAVETPDPEWQKSLNKEVTAEQTISIIKEAKAAGWRVAKFYFMIGLPPSDGEDESDMILDFLFRVQDETKMNLNVNIGTFVPKSHTPYERAPQLYEEESLTRIYKIKNNLKKRNIKLGYHSPFMSFLEGIFSRGDERVGDILLEAYKKGARLDAWEEYVDRKLWREVIERQDWDVETETCRGKEKDEILPWNNISMGVSPKYLEKEMEKSESGELTDICDEECSHLCGVCNNEIKVVNHKKPISDKLEKGILDNTDLKTVDSETAEQNNLVSENGRYRAVFAFEKKGKQIYLGHLNVMRVFEKAFLRSRLNLNFTKGFNPKPRIEFAHPLSLGVESLSEIASVELKSDIDSEIFIEKMNLSLPEGLKIKNCYVYRIETGDKIHSLMSLYSGTEFRINSKDNEKLLTQLKNYINENEMDEFAYADAVFDADAKAVYGADVSVISLMVKPGNKKANLIKILKELTGDEYPLSVINALVVKNYAHGSGGDMMDYISFYKEIMESI